MFEAGPQNSMVLPQNWRQMTEESNLWLLAEKCMEILGIRHAYVEAPVAIEVSQRQDHLRFIDGLLISLQESVITQSNWATTSELEKGRMEGTIRRAMQIASREQIPWGLMKHHKSNVSPTLNYTDSLYLRVTSIIQTRTHHQKIGTWLTKLYNSAQLRLARENNEKISDYVISFDEAWASIGDTKKDSAGRVKLDKAGNPRRYHPSKPDFSGMEKTEVILMKEDLSDLWQSIDALRSLWNDNTKPANYAHYMRAARQLYNSQVKATKSVKALADARIEALGLPRTAPKAAISNRKAQRIATGDYDPVFRRRDLRVISVTSTLEMTQVLFSLNEACESWTEGPNSREQAERRITILSRQRRDLLNAVDLVDE